MTNVQDNTTVTVRFNSAIDPNSIQNMGVRLLVANTSANVPFTFTTSADGKTFTITPATPFSAATQYLLYVDYGTVRDQAGNAEVDSWR